MKESDVESDCVEQLTKFCPGSVIYKHADRWTAGIPDRSISWRRYDSWLEFKCWDFSTTFHDEFATKGTGRANTQLLELCKLERQTGRAWIVAYRKANPRKLIRPALELYRPGALVDASGFVMNPEHDPRRLTPVLCTLENVALYLRMNGMVRFDGFDHRAVVSLIHLTHRKEYDPQ